MAKSIVRARNKLIKYGKNRNLKALNICTKPLYFLRFADERVGYKEM